MLSPGKRKLQARTGIRKISWRKKFCFTCGPFAKGYSGDCQINWFSFTKQTFRKSDFPFQKFDFFTNLNPFFQESKQKSSGSPYLNLKASNVGLSPLLNRRKIDKSSSLERRDTDTLADKFMIFKKPRLTIKNTTVKPTLSSDMAFDGLGGTSKKENTDFPTPLIRSSNILTSSTSHSLKRIPSAKFKKLTKTPSLGRIDTFLLKD